MRLLIFFVNVANVYYIYASCTATPLSTAAVH